MIKRIEIREENCPKCKGTGKTGFIFTWWCKMCEGDGTVERRTVIEEV
jgi:DnaJ-class molecular chaperone